MQWVNVVRPQRLRPDHQQEGRTLDQLGLPTSPTEEEEAMRQKTIDQKTMDRRVAELSAEMVRLDRELRVEKAFRLDAERSLRAYRARSLSGFLARLWGGR